MRKVLVGLCLLIFMSPGLAVAANPVCQDAKIFEKIIDQICWSCFLPMRIMGVGPAPDGAAGNDRFCQCTDRMGVPEYGWTLGYWSPVRLAEIVRTPWCSPSLGGIQLQDDLFSLGHGVDRGEGSEGSLSFAQYHWFSYPIMEMLQILFLSDCQVDQYHDFDLMYFSEIDPTWNNDLTALFLNPEALVFANPIAKLWCVADCTTTTAGHQQEKSWGCAGCDGNLYPFTGFVADTDDPVRNSSLLMQRALASLHRKGLAAKSMGEDAMCERVFWPTIPRSQYKTSLIFPVPEASTTGPAGKCCHPLGESTNVWSVAAGGRHRPGKEDFVYLIWRYRDCCVRGSDSTGG